MAVKSALTIPVELIKMLNDMRVGEVSPESDKLLRSLARPVKYLDGIAPTELFPMRRMADRSNYLHLDRLAGQLRVFTSQDILGRDEYKDDIHPTDGNRLLDRMIVPKKVKLKVRVIPGYKAWVLLKLVYRSGPK